MIWVEPGEFTMGNPEGEALEDETPHKVNLTKGFYLGKHEVTQQQYEAVVMQGSNGVDSTPSYYSGVVESISWDDIQIFLTLVNQNASLTLERGWSLFYQLKLNGNMPVGQAQQLDIQVEIL